MEKIIVANAYKSHLKSGESLVTSYEATRAGFVSLALEKNKRATPMVEEAKALKINVAFVKKPKDLLDKKDIYPSLLTASGLSEKSINYLTDEDKKNAILNLIENFLEPAGGSFVEELIYRFLLTKGDTLGGIMRNVAGYLGEVKLSRALLSTLRVKGYNYYWFDSRSKIWVERQEDETGIEYFVKGFYWYNKVKRTLFYNIGLPLVGKNIDIVLIEGDVRLKKIKDITENEFVALGELKGGIDPAGADEHWKTANSALGRIREAFRKKTLTPKTIFIGAAIEKSMAQEIYHQLGTNMLDNAANLTIDEQLYSICTWLVDL
ncbi:MAG TPA: AvaI/BsoBI family type II restriction endonuclease [Ignavibacteria bacterium]